MKFHNICCSVLVTAIAIFIGSPSEAAPLPFRGKASAHDQISTDPRCPILASTIIGHGTATQLGRFTVLMQDCFSPAGPPFIFQNGLLTLTAADGSTVTGTYQGQLVPLPTSSQDGTFGIHGTYTFTGGTGRFTNVTGSGVIVGTDNTFTGDVQADFVGTLNL
jgi:hypothetical protein